MDIFNEYKNKTSSEIRKFLVEEVGINADDMSRAELLIELEKVDLKLKKEAKKKRLAELEKLLLIIDDEIASMDATE